MSHIRYAARTTVIFFYIANKGVSLLENAGHLGLPIPDKMKAVLGSSMTAAKAELKMKRRMSDYETDAIYLVEKSLLYGREENYGKRTNASFRRLSTAWYPAQIQHLKASAWKA